MATRGGDVQAARGKPSFRPLTTVGGVAEGTIEIGASTPVVAPLCVALLNTKGIIAEARSNKEYLEEIWQMSVAIMGLVIDRAKASENYIIRISPFRECIVNLGEVAKRHSTQGRMARTVLARANGEDIQELRRRIEALVPIMGLGMDLDQGTMSFAAEIHEALEAAKDAEEAGIEVADERQKPGMHQPDAQDTPREGGKAEEELDAEGDEGKEGSEGQVNPKSDSEGSLTRELGDKVNEPEKGPQSSPQPESSLQEGGGSGGGGGRDQGDGGGGRGGGGGNSSDGKGSDDGEGNDNGGGGGGVDGAGAGGRHQATVEWLTGKGKFAREDDTGEDLLDYMPYATALAGLFGTGETDVLPAAVGIYAPWGSGKSFLLNKLKSKLSVSEPEGPSCLEIWCCCCVSFWSVVEHSVFGVVACITCKELRSRLSECAKTCRSKPENDQEQQVDIEAADGGSEDDGHQGREFIVVDFNAWECAGLDILWAAVITKIFDKVEAHPGFGRGAVRAARIKKLLEDPTWNWCGLVTFFFLIAVAGVFVIIILHVTGATADINNAVGWLVALGLPVALTTLKLCLEMRSRGGSLETAQMVVQRAISKKESVGESYRGFMSDVKEELETLFDIINDHNKAVTAFNRKINDQTGPGAGRKTLALAVIVDDLDRCPKEKVMDMLRATHLLLEQRKAPMAVFLAVDPQLVVSAIAQSLGGDLSMMKALQYLDKIIHLPFCIPPVSAGQRSKYLDKLLNGTDNSCRKTLPRLKEFLKGSNLLAVETWEVKALILENNGCILLNKSALELVLTLKRWTDAETAPAAITDGLKTFLTALEGIRDEKSGQPLEEMLPNVAEDGVSLDRLLRELNSVVNDVMTSGRKEAVKITPRPVLAARSLSAAAALSAGAAPSASSSLATAKAATEALVAAAAAASAPIPAPPVNFSRAISVVENMAFQSLFKVVEAGPRKIKRVVNMYFLQRSLAETSSWWEENPDASAKALVAWTILAEFWPFRLSCIAFAMTHGAKEYSRFRRDDDDTIVSVYEGSAGNASVRTWIQAHRKGSTEDLYLSDSPELRVRTWIRAHRKGSVEDLYLSDSPEHRFQLAIESSVPQISRIQVIGFLLPHSFNLNPAIMSIVEVEMSEEAIATRTTFPKTEPQAATSPTQPTSHDQAEDEVSDEKEEHALFN